MLKSYRRRFILSNMLLSGMVLLITFTVLGAASCRNDYNELQNTMSIILRPWNKQGNEPDGGDRFLREPREETPDMAPPGDRDGDKGSRDHHTEPFDDIKQDEDNKDMYSKFTTVFYDEYSEEVTFISESTSINSTVVAEALQEISSAEEQFGIIRKYGLIFYKEKTQRDFKVSLIASSYLTAQIWENLLFFLFLFIVSMGFIFWISLKLSAQAVKPLEQAIEMERSFVADISHDLKTPITIVLTNNSILKSNPDMPPEERRQWTSSTDEAAKNMMKLVNEMLTLSSLESVERTVVKERVSLSSAAEKCVLQLESVAYEHEIIVNDDIEEDVFISSTPEYTERICSGLIENALKYEPKGGTVEVAVKKEKKTAKLTVKNNGSVITEEDLPHIFERFYRGDKARSERKGHGLGLPIIKQITELVDAEITAESSPQNGTVFTVKFELDE